MWNIRLAAPDDADVVCEVLRASITELCVLDHENDPVALDRWLANKTPQNVRLWIEANSEGFFVAENGNRIGGVGSVRPDGYIILNYVAPWGRSNGIGKMLMVSMEARAAALGNHACSLISTVTAHGFYKKFGYESAGDPVASFGAKPAYPMRRTLLLL